MQYHVDGDLVPAEEATVSVRDRGFMYGDAAFETLRAYGGDVFEWRAHVERLERTCESLGIDHGVSDADLRVRVQEVLDANDLDDAYVRLSITRGVQPGKLTPSPDVDPTVVVIAKELPRGGVEGSPVWDDPATVQTVETRKPADAALPADAKTHNYLNGILARNELVDADEALLRGPEGDVAEGATSNLFFVDDAGLHTPSEDLPILPGVTRSVVADLVESETDVPLRTGRYASEDVREAEEAFLTNTSWEVRPVAAVDGVEIGDGPVTNLLARLFDALVERRHY
ncbi:aminodeoxychorismate lyase [Halostella sp. JP-L12]|uniref:aminotransferase class IV n=1 Tax=Halostella TaxID=1843185 RepID=UPI000EF7D1C7|nr:MULTISPECIES: aminotransferase class IV [Halostella]NHN47615.1 aminodeoxychorismate lyase [Halostella sp. JP-L12]